jgi:hypothetical protein
MSGCEDAGPFGVQRRWILVNIGEGVLCSQLVVTEPRGGYDVVSDEYTIQSIDFTTLD